MSRARSKGAAAPAPAALNVKPKVARKATPRRGNGVLGSGRLKALTSAVMVAERLNIVLSRLLKLAPTVMLGICELIPNERSNAGEAWLQAAARRMPTAATRALESQQLKGALPIGQHWSLGALPTMPHLDPRDGVGMVIAESVSKLPFVIFVAEKAQASFVLAMVAFYAFARRDFPDVGPFVINGDSDLWWSTSDGSEPAALEAYFATMSKPTQFLRLPPGTQALNPMEPLMGEVWYAAKANLFRGHLSAAFLPDMLRAAAYQLRFRPVKHQSTWKTRGEVYYGRPMDASLMIARPGQSLLRHTLVQPSNVSTRVHDTSLVRGKGNIVEVEPRRCFAEARDAQKVRRGVQEVLRPELGRMNAQVRLVPFDALDRVAVADC
jgi:hypothetical protein